ncbi:hypothetical protein TorRG33x02_313230 [Trema orientale]|uniref:Uncharacterized protein n=1 Tax=Trema orientale TaxID=63057 RepID=A0A2P5BPV4_TREOI|nr:hypothetical protein TorRG33x02_313230 [Trema orientale]
MINNVDEPIISPTDRSLTISVSSSSAASLQFLKLGCTSGCCFKFLIWKFDVLRWLAEQERVPSRGEDNEAKSRPPHRVASLLAFLERPMRLLEKVISKSVVT